ncbi:SurA N-terminal domain-containing protein [Galbibacter mesophilus]|nr:SurA N-terminal domain-containing protein [Galbibacter mesophilus]
MELIKEYLMFIRKRKKYWLVPIFLILFIISFLVVVTASSALAPFIYSLF